MSDVIPNPREGLGFARLVMVLSSLAPLFILWAIRGNHLVPDSYFIGACVFLALLPSAFLCWRIQTAIKDNDTRNLTAGATEDHRGHVLVYLFAMLLPLYGLEIESYRDLAAVSVALALIVCLFWRLNLHYMNIFFAFAGYQVFTISPPNDDNPYTGRESYVLITRRRGLVPGERFLAYRLSNTVYLEGRE